MPLRGIWVKHCLTWGRELVPIRAPCHRPCLMSLVPVQSPSRKCSIPMSICPWLALVLSVPLLFPARIPHACFPKQTFQSVVLVNHCPKRHREMEGRRNRACAIRGMEGAHSVVLFPLTIVQICRFWAFPDECYSFWSRLFKCVDRAEVSTREKPVLLWKHFIKACSLWLTAISVQKRHLLSWDDNERKENKKFPQKQPKVPPSQFSCPGQLSSVTARSTCLSHSVKVSTETPDPELLLLSWFTSD